MILSFAYTTPALLAGRKTVTRRDWKAHHAGRFDTAHYSDAASGLHDAYDKSPRNGGRNVGLVRVLSVVREPITLMPDSDYEAEGFAYLHEQGIKPPKSAPFPDFSWESFEAWRASGVTLYVVRFELIAVSAGHAPEAGAAGR